MHARFACFTAIKLTSRQFAPFSRLFYVQLHTIDKSNNIVRCLGCVAQTANTYIYIYRHTPTHTQKRLRCVQRYWSGSIRCWAFSMLGCECVYCWPTYRAGGELTPNRARAAWFKFPFDQPTTRRPRRSNWNANLAFGIGTYWNEFIFRICLCGLLHAYHLT